jgi:wee1-like protein kinase
VKPDNIFESEKKIYKLGDWGRATSTCGEKRRKLIGGASEIDGDQRYLANEVLNDDFSNLAKSDVWSLGATALELLLGEALPMNGDKYRALRDGRSVNENFEDFGLSEFSCSEEMKALLKLMLAKDPESRPTAKEIMVECEKLLCLTSAMESSML